MKKSIKLLSVIMAVIMLVSAVAVFAYDTKEYVEIGQDENLADVSKKYAGVYLQFNGDSAVCNDYYFVSANNNGYTIYHKDGALFVDDGILYAGNYCYETKGKVSVDVNKDQVWYNEGGYLYTDVTDEKTTTSLSGFFSLFTRFVPKNYVSTTRYYLAYDEEYNDLTVSTLPVDRVTILRRADQKNAEDVANLYHECKAIVDVQQTASVSSFLSWLMGGTRGNVYSDQYTMTISVDMDYTVPYSVSYYLCDNIDLQYFIETIGDEAYKTIHSKYNNGEYDESDVATIFASFYTFTDYYGVASFTKTADSDWPYILIKINYFDEKGDNCTIQCASYNEELGYYVTDVDFISDIFKLK